MIKRGSLVKRVGSGCLTHIHIRVLSESYPPEDAVCVVITSPKERDLAYQAFDPKRSGGESINMVSLKKAIDVMSGNKVYKDCELSAFKAVK